MSGETRTATKQSAQPAPTRAQEVAVIESRIPYRVAAQAYDISESAWDTLINATFPSAKTAEGIMLALAYCKKRNLDIFKKCVHIVPMYVTVVSKDNKKSSKQIETVWPGIAEVRITAHRTGEYCGIDEPTYGPMTKKVFELPVYNNNDDGDHPNAPPSDTPKTKAPPKTITLEFPEWCRHTVYRLVKGVRCPFVGPRVMWLEAYATAGKNSDCPNEMWRDRPDGQLQKCSEAASLRAAFPEEMGGEYIIDEAHKFVDVTPGAAAGAAAAVDDTPEVRPDRSSIHDTPAARAARDKQRASAETIDPKTGEILVGEKKADDKPADKPTDQPADSGPPQMSEKLEHALSVLAKCHDAAEMEGMKAGAKSDLTEDEYKVWATALAHAQRRAAGGKR